MFHVKNNMCFERIDYNTTLQPCGDNDPCRYPSEMFGGVRVCMLRPNEKMLSGAGVTILIMTASEWASVVASMSALGESFTTHAMFLAAQKC